MFQSTHPGWGATADSTASTRVARVSIHAPRVGCDKAARVGGSIVGCFNPRTPGGVRHPFLRGLSPSVEFQSTHPGWGATFYLMQEARIYGFNPRTPGGVRPFQIFRIILRFLFQSTHPGRGATILVYLRFLYFSFNPRTPGGVRLYKKERAESQGNMWYVLRTYWCRFPLNKLSDFSFKLSS